jgi:hypothetical protein
LLHSRESVHWFLHYQKLSGEALVDWLAPRVAPRTLPPREYESW